MRSLTFRGGVHPPERKELAKDSAIRRFDNPTKVFLFLSNHAGVPAKPLVEPGDLVKTGQKIAEVAGYVSANLHSSITGKVVSIEKAYHPTLQKPDQAIVIERTGEDDWQLLEPARSFSDLSKEELLERIKDAGIVGLGGAMFPAHVKLSPPEDRKIETLVINGAECEPYLTIDDRMMVEHADGIIRGTLAIMKILGVNEAVVGIEDNKPDAVASMKKAARETRIRVTAVKTKYPQGAEKQLIYSLLKRVVPSEGLPMDAGVVVHNVSTAFAIYEAVELGKPLIERGLTITGDCANNPTNVIVRIGTLASEIIDHAGGSREDDLDRIVFGGPMMGIAVPKLDVPVVKGSSGLTLLSKMSASSKELFSCIRCSRCVVACPILLEPYLLNLYTAKKRYDPAVELGLLDCIECGACSFACPAGIDLVKSFVLAKKVYRTLKKGAKR